MTRSLKTAAAATAIIGALAVGPILYAQTQSADPQGHHGMMKGGQGDMMGMMKMMQQMSGMMEACTKMMQSVAPAPEAPKDKAPEKKNG
jgi:membrane protease subunit (stomatin/prohibitin family)